MTDSELNHTIAMQRLTKRGFQVIAFDDANMAECAIQQSSKTDGTERSGSAYVWLGRDDVRMHLHRDQIPWLVECLSYFHATGCLPGQWGDQ